MNKIFKYLMGVFILGICFINTTHATINRSIYFNYICEDTNCYSEGVSLPKPFVGDIPGDITVACTMTQLNTNTCQASQQCFDTVFDGNMNIYIDFVWNDGISSTESTMSNYNSNTYLIDNENLFNYLSDGNVPNGQFPVIFDLYAERETLAQNSNGSIQIDCEIDGDFTETFTGGTSGTGTCPTCPTCPTCEEQYTSLECQTEYNLIPINDVNANYCKLNFDLIEPTDCPGIGEGTGEINRTARYINNVQYPGTASLKIDIADFLEYSTTYNSGETLVDIIGVDADEEYIEDIITKTQITPTAEDFGNLINGLQAFIPYVMIGLLLSFAILLIKKVFK